MPITRFHSLSDIELERELERRLDAEGQLVLGSELSREVMERIRKWIDQLSHTEEPKNVNV